VLNLSDFCSFEGKTGPYLLYAAVRVKSILSKAAERGLEAGPIVLGGEHDRALALALSRLPGVVAQVHAKKTPHLLCEYLFELSQSFSAFYQHCNIVREEDEAQRAGWLSLAALCLKTLTTGLGLLGVEVPERM
jgi:arginyl-tRNA synthetase